MKVSLITDGIYPYVIGGMQRHSFYMVKYLARNGVKVDLYHTNKQKDWKIEQLEGFSEDELVNITNISIAYPQFRILFPGHYLCASYIYSRRVYKELKKRSSSDFIYTKGLAGWETLRKRSVGELKTKVGIKVHGYEMYQYAPNWKIKLQHLLLRPAFLYVNRNADWVFSYGGKITDLITNKLHIPKSQIIEIPSGIDESWVSEKGAESINPIRKFVFIGRYERRKGIEELHSVLKELIQTDLKFCFTFIGPIQKNHRIENDQIRYLGAISDNEIIRNTLIESDILVCPSYSEGMPNVILEGMATGNAVIATDVGAVNRLVDEKNGWLLDTGFLKDRLSSAMLDALQCERNILLKKGEISRNRIISSFTWSSIGDDLLHVLKSL